MTPRAKGLLITAIGMLFVTPDSLFVRLIDADPLAVAFWRGFTSGALLLLVVLITPKLGRIKDLRTAGWPALGYALLIGSTTIGFIMAIKNTSVANTVFILATMPLFAALFSWLFLREPISRRIALTMVAAFAGIGIIALGSDVSGVAHWSGDLWAMFTAAAYAGALTLVRRAKHVSMVPAIPFAYIGVALLLLLVIDPLPALAAFWPLILLHGAFIAVATCLFAIGPRLVSAPEVALLVLLESVLAPILVWAVIGEAPGQMALLGGAVVIGALLVSNLAALRRGA
jgi:drug/metabolite transporter (DMT)-like permease